MDVGPTDVSVEAASDLGEAGIGFKWLSKGLSKSCFTGCLWALSKFNSPNQRPGDLRRGLGPLGPKLVLPELRFWTRC
jgi:hypothetical protein